MNWAGLSIVLGVGSLAFAISPWLFGALLTASVVYLFAKS